MGLTNPNQQLRRDLKEAAFTLEEFAQDLFKAAQKYHSTDFLAAMEKIGKLHEQVDRLRAYADEVKEGQIERARPG